MKHLLFSLTFFSFLSFSGLQSNEPLLTDPMELLSLAEEDSDLDEEISSLEKEISNSEQDTLEGIVSTTLPEISTKISVQEDPEAPLFSSLEEPSPIRLATNLIDGPSTQVSAESLADPFGEETELEAPVSKTGLEINLIQVFSASPLIYCLLISLSLTSIAIWLYSMSRLKYQGSISEPLKHEIESKLQERRFDEALDLCKNKQSLLTQLMSSAISSQKYGSASILENMKSEGKRATVSSWQRLSLLQDIAVIAPMIGLLGTVLGMFYAFYDLNRSFESMSNLFDGFGIAVGTTVAGIGVAILAMILHSTIKFRLVQSLARVENEASSLVRFLNEKQS